MTTAEKIVSALLGEGRVGEWFRDRWEDVKDVTGIGRDEFGMGKAEKGFKPKFGPVKGSYKSRRVVPTPSIDPKTWDIK